VAELKAAWLDERMETMMITDLQIAMSGCLFLLGFCSCVAGLWTILSRRYQQTLKSISAQSAKVSSKAITDAGLAPLIEALSGLVKAIDQLVRTSAGIGVFLCLAGITLCLAAFWMLSRL
jgi:hypothetical protein